MRTKSFRSGFTAAVIIPMLAISARLLADNATPCGNPDPTPEPCGPCQGKGGDSESSPDAPGPGGDPGNADGGGGSGSSSSSGGPAPGGGTSFFGATPTVPVSSASIAPVTDQRFFTPAGSNVSSSALDFSVHGTTGRLPLEFKRYYQSRVREGISDDMGQGLTWTHSYSYSLWYSGTGGKRSLIYPDGRVREFTAGATVTFEGGQQTIHSPAEGYGERMYSGGPGGNTFTLVMADASRVVFERVTIAGQTLYHPRYARDPDGRQQTFTTDAKTRITSATDTGGNSISLIYGPIQINRKENVLLKEITATPATGWNEFLRPTTGAYRWFQVESSSKNFCNFAEVEFYGKDANGNEVKLSGTPYGTGPSHIDFQTSTFEKAFDGNTSTSFRFARSIFGITGIDLGAGNETKLTKIRFNPNAGPGAVPMADFIGSKFQVVRSAPQIVDVLQRVETSDGRAANYLYETVNDPSIDQNHLVLSGVDYDGNGLATEATDARFTYTLTNEGRGPSVETIYEPRSTGEIPFLKYEYLSARLDTRGMVSKVRDAVTNEIIVENIPEAARIIRFPGGRDLKVAFTPNNPRFSAITDASGQTTDYKWSGTSKFLEKTTDPGGRFVLFDFNSRGQRTAITREDGMSEDTEYDGSGRIVKHTRKAAGFPDQVTQWTREPSGLITRIDFPDTSFVSYTYNALGLLDEKHERNGSTTKWIYDPSGLLLTLTYAQGSAVEESWNYTYYGLGDLTGSPARMLKTVTDPRGRVTAYEYDTRGLLTKTTYPDGSFRQMGYDEFARRLSETDGIHSSSRTYNSLGKTVTATDPLGHTTNYFYGVGGIVCSCYNKGGPTRIVSPEGRVTLREYDVQWRLKKETGGLAIPGSTIAPAPATTEWLYDPVGDLAMKTLPGGVVRSYQYDSRHRLVQELYPAPPVPGQPANFSTFRTYDSFGRLKTVSPPGVRTVTYAYDSMNRVKQLTDPEGSDTYLYFDLAGNRVKSIDDAGRKTEFFHDLRNRPVRTLFADNSEVTMSYHTGGERATYTDELQHTVSTDTVLLTWSDSAGGNWTSFASTRTDALGNITRSYPAPMSRFAGISKTVSPLGRASETYRNADGTTASTVTGLSLAPAPFGGGGIPADITTTEYEYDADHLLLSSTIDPNGLALETSYEYDARANRTKMTDPIGRPTRTEYDLRGNPVKTILPDLREQTSTYDALDRRSTSTDAKQQTTQYFYHYETTSMIGLRDPKNQLTQWTYDKTLQVKSKTYANGDKDEYTYDNLHRLFTHKTPKLEICTYSYDLRDRLLLTDWNSSTPDTTRTYFANGLLKSIDNSVSKSDYAYSVRNELSSEIQTLAGQAARTVSYSYDADGLRQQMNSPSGSPVDYTWTAKAQLADISRDGPPPLADYNYDKAGRLLSTAHENGITEAKSYNAASELLSTLHQQGGHTYTYDATGRRTAETFANPGTPARTYGYDNADQVTSANYGNNQTDAYAYDPMGNRTSTTRGGGLYPPSQTYTTNTANQYTSITNFAPITHDPNGNLLQQNGATYTWDSENRLLSVTDGTTTNTFTYDGHHRRVTKRTAVSGTVTSKAHFIYEGWNVIEEYESTSTSRTFDVTTFDLRRTLTWGTDLSGTLQGAGGVGGLLMTEEINGQTTEAYHFHYDGNGNVTEITDNTGSNAATYRYDAFGNTLVATGTYAATNKYRFSTKPIDTEVATATLYYYGYRYYDPVTGRWPSRDPIAERGGVNLYGFVGNDALSRWDYLGNKPKATACKGTCGADIDDWIIDELDAQIKGWDAWKKANTKGRSPTIKEYLKWANGNQRYKDANFFEFSKGTPCGTKPDPKLPGCGFSVTICGKCVRSAILGNIIYGIIGAGDFNPGQLAEANDVKESWGMTVDTYDTAAYSAGWLLANPLAVGPPTVPGIPKTVGDFCAKFDVIVANMPSAIREGTGNGADYNDLGGCKPCGSKTKEARHGGSDKPRSIP